MADGDHRMPAAERIARLLAELGLERAHFGAQISADLDAILVGRPAAVASLALLNPVRLTPDVLTPLGDRLFLCSGDQGLAAGLAARRAALTQARQTAFPGEEVFSWTDTAALHADDVEQGMRAAIAAGEAAGPASRLDAAGRNGEIAGLSYRVDGNGPALVLLPLLLAPSQWQPVVERLARDFAVIRISGPALGMIRILETRGSTPGYLRIVRNIVDDMALRPGERIVDVGCGTGAIDRWLVGATGGANPITAVDLNPFLLGEARALAAAAGVAAGIDFAEGDAEALPFGDASFDAALSFTVMEEGDADAMLAELIRVVRPGGRVAAMVRGVDRPLLWNLPLPPGLKARVEAPVVSVGAKGCADASLYTRFANAGLADLRFYPHIMTSDDPGGPITAFYEPHVLSLLDADEAEVWHRAKAEAVAAGTFLFARVHHCAVGTKPG